MKYVEMYAFSVIDKIQDGYTVFCTDRQVLATTCCNNMVVSNLVELLEAAKNDETRRYQFYYTDNSEEVQKDESVSDE